MKLWCQLPVKMDLSSPEASVFSNIAMKGYERVKRGDTEIVLKALDKGLEAAHMAYPGLRFLNDREILKSVTKAQKEGFDGVVISCFFDPSLRASRQQLNIPVVGMAEASMHLASMMGLRFAIITSDPSYIQEIEENLHRYGMQLNAIARNPVRAIPISCEEFFGCLGGNFKPTINGFKEAAWDCIKDGAEVLIAGCGLMSPMLTEERCLEVEGAPIIDPMLIGIKMAEMLVDLAKAHLPFISRKGLYRKACDEEIERVMREMF